MALANYTDLVAAITRWDKRTDMADRAPDFIQLAEVRMKSLLTAKLFEKTASLNTVVGVDSINLPTDYKAPIALWLDQYTDRDGLDQLLVEELPYTTTQAQPRYWAIDGAVIRFQAPADVVYPIKFRYEPVYALTEAAPTNLIMTKYPDCYLFGALLESATYSFDDAAAQKWNARFMDAVRRSNRQEAKANKNVNLRTELGRFGSSRFDIRRGY